MSEDDSKPPEVPSFEGREVPREPSGRVSREYRSDPSVQDQTIGTPEQITALTIKLAELKAQGGLRGARGTLYKRLNLERARLMRRRDRMTRDKLKLRLVKAQATEKSARIAVEEAGKALEGTARILKNAITDFGKAAVDELLPSLIADLKSQDQDFRREAQRIMRDITVAIIELQKTARKEEAQSRKRIKTVWPSEGLKS